MLELAFSGVAFFIAMFGLLEMGRYMTTQNTLAEAARRGARYAATKSNSSADQTKVKNMVIYRQETTGTSPVAPGLATNHVNLTYSTGYSMKAGQVTVTIQDYQFSLTVPLIGSTFTMKPISMTANAESAGVVPSNI